MPDPATAFTPEYRDLLELVSVSPLTGQASLDRYQRAIAAALVEIDRLRAERDELLAAHEPERSGPDFLDWVADRLVNVHGESPNVDFVIALRRRAVKARAAVARAENRDEQSPPTETPGVE